ncbi:MAG: AAA family ATPase, partial [Myxococcales bacterium]|nr:AAA family ATPase [Myxococcales bacterium]
MIATSGGTSSSASTHTTNSHSIARSGGFEVRIPTVCYSTRDGASSMFPPEPGAIGFFGRARELERLRALADEAREGAARGRAVLITGPAGVGKSRLMAELRRGLRDDGELALECWCRPFDTRPHGPLVDLLAAGVGLMAELGRPAPNTERALNLMTGLAGPEAEAGRGERTLFFYETVRQALIELAVVHPSVLFMHDLHWADAATIGLLRYLLENLLTDPAFDWTPPDAGLDGTPLVHPSLRGLFVVSFRDAPVAAPLVEAARATASVEHIPLAGLDADGVRAFLQSPAVVERVLQATEGTPLALEHLLDALPRDPTTLWSRQLDALPTEARAVLDVLAVHREACTL